MSRTIFNDSWSFSEFELGTSYETMVSSSLYEVDLPHDWMIYHTSDLYKNSIGFYKKSFNLSPVPGHHYFICFEGVYMDTKVYLNDEEIFEWKYGYSTFEVDLTPYVREGLNTLCVSCTYRSPNTRWYSGAGIYRNVYFIDKDYAYLPSGGTYISTEKVDGGFIVHIDTEVIADKSVDCNLSHVIKDASGNVIARSDAFITASETLSVDNRDLMISNPILWDISSPYLYAVETTLNISEKIIDFEKNPLGFRTIEFDCNKGFFLNGRNVKINGACQHHDLGALGAAMNKTALRRQFDKLVEMGVNSIRTSHNMPAKELMELADEMGILIFTESFDMWERPKTQYDYGNFFPTWWETDVTSWVRRDRNHPSLIIWSIGNEIYDTHAGTGLKWTKLLRDKIRELDYRHNAYIGIGSNYIEWDNAQKCSDELELSGYNYGERLYDAHHKKYPHWCIFGSETSSTVQSRGIYHFPLEQRLLTFEDAQCSCLGNCTTNWGARDTNIVITNHRDRDYVFGQYIWTGWDYIGEPTPYFSKNSFFGQIDTAGFEKDTFYHYQAEWRDLSHGYMVHLLPYWDFNEGQIIDVCAYSNAPFVELFLNGTSLGRQEIDHLHGLFLQGHWKVPYEKGELLCIAYDDNGMEVARDVQKSFTDPVAISLQVDKTTLQANGQDLAFLEISSFDKDGTLVANGKSRVTVSVTGAGRLVGLDNGDSTDYDEYKGTSRRLFSGKLLAIIASTEDTGVINVEVTSEGLTSAKLSLTAVKSDSDYIAPCRTRNTPSLNNPEIPVRKIALVNRGMFSLNADTPETDVEFEIFPSNATYRDVIFKALTKDAVEANFVKISVNGNVAHVTALGDGEFKLTAFANNDKDHAEIISELEFSVTGLGKATYNPYEMIPGCEYSSSHTNECKLSFNGGVFIPANGDAYVTYDNIDFGAFGSDEVTLPIFSFSNEMDLEILEGTYENGTLLCKDTYRAQSIYNTYQANTFKLSRRIRGVSSITFVFHCHERFSLEGFRFTKLEKAYSTNLAIENSTIVGDSFTVTESSIDSIGNNVAIEFDGMDFSNKGVSKLVINGRSNKPVTSLHLLFMEGDTNIRQMVEIPYSEYASEHTFDLKDVRTNGKFGFMFLPGSDFDLISFRFIPAK